MNTATKIVTIVLFVFTTTAWSQQDPKHECPQNSLKVFSKSTKSSLCLSLQNTDKPHGWPSNTECIPTKKFVTEIESGKAEFTILPPGWDAKSTLRFLKDFEFCCIESGGARMKADDPESFKVYGVGILEDGNGLQYDAQSAGSFGINIEKVK